MKLLDQIGFMIVVNYFGTNLSVYEGWWIATSPNGFVNAYASEPFQCREGDWHAPEPRISVIPLGTVDLEGMDSSQTLMHCVRPNLKGSA